MPARTIRAQTVMSLLRHVLDPTGRRTIIWDAPIGRYIRGGPAAVRAFHKPLNTSPEFSGYGLNLSPGDLAAVSSVADIGTVLIKWFQKNNWTVIV